MKQRLGSLGGQLGIGLALLGFLLIFLGWNGAGSYDDVPAQFPYLISGGIAGPRPGSKARVNSGGDP